MARRLTANVVLRHPDSGAVTCLPSGSELPAWAADRVGDHVLTGGASSSTAPSGDGPPPRSGKGSSDAAWTAYARTQGVEVSEDMSRSEVIAACEAAGVPT